MRMIIIAALMAALMPALTTLAANYPFAKPKVSNLAEIRWARRAAAPAADDEQKIKVTVELAYDAANGVTPSMFTYAVPKGILWIYGGMPISDTTLEFELPAGTYDFMFPFNAEYGNQYFVCRENVEVTADMEMKVSVDEADQLITFAPILPDGSALQTPLTDMREEPGDTEVSDAYTSPVAFYDLNFVHKDVGPLISVAGTLDRAIFPDGEIKDIWPKVHVNKAESFFCYNVLSAAPMADEGASYFMLFSEKLESQTVTNDPAWFISLTVDFAPAQEKPTDSYPGAQMTHAISWEEYRLVSTTHGLTGASWDESKINLFNPYETYPDWFKFSQLYVVPMQTAYVTKNQYGSSEYHGVIAPMATHEGKEWSFSTLRGVGNRSNASALPTMNYDDLGRQIPFTNPGFSITGQDVPLFGGNAPSLLFVRRLHMMEYDFIGRYGEVRTCDKMTTRFSVKFNGEEVCASAAELTAFLRTPAAREKGNWEVNVDDVGLKVDGHDAYCSSRISWGADEEVLTPVVTQVQLRDASGLITDRFARAADGVLRVSAGAFSYVRGDEEHFAYEPLESFSVEYAPYGTDAFAPLESEMKQDLFFIPSFGAVYEAALGQVLAKSANGWFDIRISTADRLGNKSVQTISPAFRIEALSGVDKIAGSAAVSVRNGIVSAGEANARITLISSTGSAVAEGVGSVDARHLPHGIYFACTGGSVTKILL